MRSRTTAASTSLLLAAVHELAEQSFSSERCIRWRFHLYWIEAARSRVFGRLAMRSTQPQRTLVLCALVLHDKLAHPAHRQLVGDEEALNVH